VHRLSIIVFLSVFSFYGSPLAQSTTQFNTNTKVTSNRNSFKSWLAKDWIPVKYAYIHAGMGIGPSHFSSSDIEQFSDPYNLAKVSGNKTYQIQFGLRNILQIE